MFGGGFEDLFGGMGGMGGMPGMGGMGGMPRKPKGDTTKLYKTLGVGKKATQTEIRKAYRKLARTHHPDRGGDAEKFKEVQNAYDCLNNAEKRKAYDATGDPDADPRSVRGMPRKRKGKNTMFELEVPLDQFYNGATRKIKVTKTIICNICDGKGGQGVAPCTLCRGRGMRIVDRQIGPGMIQRMQMQCNACHGRGEVIPQGKACKSCRSAGTKKEGKILSVVIEKGMKHGAKVTFSEEGDQHPDLTPGDVIVVLRRRAHPKMKRTPDGCHLIMKQKISLLDALTGFSFLVEQLDGRVLVVSSEPNKIYKTGDIKAIREEGMPLRGDVMTHGHLYIELEVVFPKSLNASKAASLKTILGPPAEAKQATSEQESYVLEEVDIEAEQAAYKKLIADNPSQYDSDDEAAGEGQQVGCRAQ